MNIFEIKIIDGNIFQFVFKNQKELGRHMVRMEEFYESPEFKDRHFTLKEYIPWYRKKYGKWSYYQDWNGFNIPDKSIKKFRLLFSDLRPEEKRILKKLPVDGEFYVLATHKERSKANKNVLDHEICHAKFYLNRSYRKEMSDLITSHRKKLSKLSEWILISYDIGVLDDEIQAYMATSDEKFLSDFFENHNEMKKLSKIFNNVFRKYDGK
jgi:hypothetical protein